MEWPLYLSVQLKEVCLLVNPRKRGGPVCLSIALKEVWHMHVNRTKGSVAYGSVRPRKAGVVYGPINPSNGGLALIFVNLSQIIPQK